MAIKIRASVKARPKVGAPRPSRGITARTRTSGVAKRRLRARDGKFAYTGSKKPTRSLQKVGFLSGRSAAKRTGTIRKRVKAGIDLKASRKGGLLRGYKSPGQVKNQLNRLVSGTNKSALLTTRQYKFKVLKTRASLLAGGAIVKAGEGLKKAQSLGSGIARAVKTAPSNFNKLSKTKKIALGVGIGSGAVAAGLIARDLNSERSGIRSTAGKAKRKIDSAFR